jgi:hypothetical protein
MKKLLMTTAAIALVAGAAQAQDPKVMVGGVIDFQAGLVNEDNDAGKRDHGFRNDTEIFFTVEGRADNGLGYGAVINLEADVSADANNEGVNASQTFVYLDGNFGRFELGSTEGSAEALAVEADSIARATGGINGDWVFFTAPTGGAFITRAALPAEHGSLFAYGDETNFNATKASYYSPRFSGLQVGVSFTPDLEERGQTVNRAENGFSDVIEAGVNYEGQFDNVGVNAAVTGLTGSSDITGVEDLEAWNAGVALSISGFSLAGSYGDWGDSGNASGVDSDYYTLGAAYDFGPFGASITWLDSTVESGAGDNDFSNLSIGADYALAPGLTPYAEVSFFEAESATAALENDGNIFIIGTELAF